MTKAKVPVEIRLTGTACNAGLFELVTVSQYLRGAFASKSLGQRNAASVVGCLA